MNEDSLKSINLKQMYELIDLYKYASIEGERVEFSVYPTKNNERIVTIKLQNGFPRDNDTFIFEDGELFDREVYPKLLSYYTHDDSIGNWDIITSEYKEASIKGSNETQTGNLVYLETYKEDYIDGLSTKLEEVEENTKFKKDELKNEDKIWDEVILYAKERRMLLDFYNGAGFDESEINIIHNFVSNLSELKDINYGKSRKALHNNEKVLKELFKNKDEVLKLGLNDKIYNKLVNTSSIKKLARIVGSEKRISKRLDIENEGINKKIVFATKELDKVEFFDLKNSKQLKEKEYVSSKSQAIKELAKLYDNTNLYDEETRKEYIDYCNELLEYLERKSLDINKVEEEKEDVKFIEYVGAKVDFEDEPKEIDSEIIKIDDKKHFEEIGKKQDKIMKSEVSIEDLQRLEQQISDYMLEQEKENEIINKKEENKPQEEFDIDLATYKLLVNKYQGNLEDKFYRGELLFDEYQVVQKVYKLKNDLLDYYNENYDNLDKMNKDEVTKFSNAELYLTTIYNIEAQYQKNRDRINKLRKEENLIPAGKLLLKTLENYEKDNVNNSLLNEIVDINISKYKEISGKYNGNLKDVNNKEVLDDKNDLEKIVLYKMKLIDNYNALLFKKNNLSKEELKLLAEYETRLLKINEIDAKYQDDIEVLINELNNNKEFLLPSSKIWLYALEQEKSIRDKSYDSKKEELNELKKDLFEIIKVEEEPKEEEYLTEIRDAYDEALSYATDKSPAIIKVIFDRNDKSLVDLIILNKIDLQDVVIYQRTIDPDKLDSTMKVLREIYSKDNKLDYNIKYDISGSDEKCLISVGENRRTLSIQYATEEFIDENKNALEEMNNKEKVK